MKPLTIADVDILPGNEYHIAMPTLSLYTDVEISIPVYVRRGKKDGPVMLLSAAIHGDELNGVETINRIINSKLLKSLKGTLIAVPMVNVFGVLNQSRYLPDRRDLNRSFPGSKKGSLAGRVAHQFFTQIVSKCDYGIDIHTGAIHRSNLPQIRANLDDEKTLAMAKAFAVPVLINANVRDGSLRQNAADKGIPMLLYEAGEALRYDELSIQSGFRGIINVMRMLEMLPPSKARKPKKVVEPFVAYQSVWMRASDSGFVRYKKRLGDQVVEKDLLAEIVDPFGRVIDQVTSNVDGIIIGKQNIPLIQEGEAMYHVACFHKMEKVADTVEAWQDNFNEQSEGNTVVV